MLTAVAGVSLYLGAATCALTAQSAAPQPPSQPSNPPSQPPSRSASPEDNPFPGETAPAPAPQNPAARKNGDAKPDSTTAKPNSDKPQGSSENPFPGEDPNAPIIPVEPGPGGTDSGAASRPSRPDSGGDSARTARRDTDPDGDPVRSPDPPGNVATDDGFTSSRAGVNQVPAEDDSDAKPGQSTKNKTREQTIKEDVDVGSYYLDRKNWKAAQARFTSAFTLDSENLDAVWGLAEAERHLNLQTEAAEHYRLFLTYDPAGRRGREARKALEEMQAARPSMTSASKMEGPVSTPPR